MKFYKYLIVIMLTLFFTACKTRHVVTAKSEVKSTENFTRVIKKDSASIDTSKKETSIKTVKIVSDSDEVDITPDSGSVQKIHIAPGGNFTYTGKAKRIAYKKKTEDNSNTDESTEVQEGKTTKQISTDSTAEKTISDQVTKSKITDAKADHGWIWAVVGIVVVLVGGVIVYLKYVKIV